MDGFCIAPLESIRPGILPVGLETVGGVLNEGANSVCRLIVERDSMGDVRVLGCEKLLAERPKVGVDGNVDRDSMGDVRVLGCEKLLAERPKVGAEGNVDRDSMGDVRVLGCEKLLAERPKVGAEGNVGRDSMGDVRVLGRENECGGEELCAER